jgi:hypothetical protein
LKEIPWVIDSTIAFVGLPSRSLELGAGCDAHSRSHFGIVSGKSKGIVMHAFKETVKKSL